ncbi:MAG: hypothetical protein ACRD88_21890, partial [Terriglobia bacterium]
MQGLEANPTHVFRAETPRPGSGAWNTISGYGMLPADFVEKAIGRLGWLALFYAIAHPIFRLVEFPGTLREALSPSQFPLVDIALVGAILSGGVICALAWSRKAPAALMLDIGLLFEVVGAFWIALVEHGMPTMVDVPFRGISSVAAWITFFVLVVPSTLGKTVLAALATACMGPVGLLTSILYYGRAVPEPGQWVQLFFANFLFAAFA